jgi:DNA-binding Xre family transcriptional regulator
MAISYNRLWKLLIDNHMKKKDLKEKAELSTATMAKLGKNESVSLDVLVRVCKVLNCEIGDVVEIVDDENMQNDLRKQ